MSAVYDDNRYPLDLNLEALHKPINAISNHPQHVDGKGASTRQLLLSIGFVMIQRWWVVMLNVKINIRQMDFNMPELGINSQKLLKIKHIIIGNSQLHQQENFFS